MSNPVVAQPLRKPRTRCSRCRHCGVVAGVPLQAPELGVPDFFIAVGAWLVFSIVSGVPILLTQEGTAVYAWALLVGVILPWLGMGAGRGWSVACAATASGSTSVCGFRAVTSGGVCCGVAALVAASIIAAGLSAVFGEFDSSAGELATSLNDFPVARFLFALAVAFGAPIVEELCYRGLLATSLLKARDE